nr:uncharacterized protein LOC109155276 isoform X1 [Ipomoea batatas]
MSFEEAETVRFHLCKYGFVPNYFEWNRHGEKSRNSTSMGFDANWSLNNEQNEPLESYQQMVIDAAGQNLIARNVGEEPNVEDKKFFDMLDAANRQLWSGCEKLTQLSAVARLLNIKTEYRLPEQCFDAFCQLFKDGLPEDNNMENDELEFDSTSRPLSPSTPSTATNGQAGQDVVRQVHGRIRIDVKGNMLTNSDVCARKITKLFKERTDPNGYTWGQLSVDTVEFYWEEFKKSFDWDDAKTTLVYNAWEMKAKIRYADYISRLRKNSRPVYISPEIWTKWNEVWNSEEGKKKTELAKKNRRSTPHVKVAAQLEQVATQREMLTGTGEQVDDNQLYYDVVGGHDKKRRIYGLGSYGCSIVNGSTSDNTSGNMTPTSRPPDNATPASVQDEIQSLKATILLMQQRLDAINGGRAGTSSSPPSQTD